MHAPSLNDPSGGRSAVDPTLREAAIASDCRWLRQWNILREVALSGRVDLGRLRAALAQAAQRHPMSRARRVAAGAGTWRWCIEAEGTAEMLRSVDTRDVGTDAVLRELQSERLSPFSAPAFRCVVVRGPAADRLVFNFCHERTDGIGAMAFLASLQRAYAGEPDASDPRTWLERRAALGTAKTPDGVAAPGLLMPEPIEHLVGDAGRGDDDGTHIVNLLLSESEAEALKRSAPAEATVTHKIVAALACACGRWNAARGRVPERICIGLPVNARPGPWQAQGFLNLFGTIFLNTNPAERATLDGAARAAMRQAQVMTPMAKEWAVHWARVGGPAADPGAVPPTVPPGFVPTAAVSSLGVWSLGPFGAAQVLQVWAPPLAQAPLAVALGVVGVRGSVCLSFRFAAAMMGREMGVAFAQAVRGLLVEMGAGRPAYARS